MRNFKSLFNKSQRRAFTLIELVVVVVVLGILATYTTQMLSRNNRAEAINHILSMMRYTQNLALHDKKHSRDDSRWQSSFWRFGIKSCPDTNALYYYIGSDGEYNGGIKTEEAAIDPSNGKFTTWYGKCPKNSTYDVLKTQVSPNIFITKKYGISNVTFTNCRIYRNGSSIAANSRKYIGFDNYGRPIKGYYRKITPNYNGHLVQDCRITFSFLDNNDPFTIIVKAETGYIYLEEKPEL